MTTPTIETAESSQDALEVQLKTQRLQARILGAIAAILVCAVVLASVIFGFVVQANSSQREETNAEQFKLNEQSIARLTAALNEAKAALDVANAAEAAALAEDDELTICTKRFDAQVSNGLSLFLTAIGDIAVAGFSTPPAPATDRQTAIDAAVTQLTSARDGYVDAIDQRSAWQESSKQLPCPVPEQ